MEPMLDVSNLSFDYLSASSCLPVIDNISFQAFEGDFISIVGPSGCGKSTLLDIIAGLMPSSAGQVFFLGEPVIKPRKEIGYMLQRDQLFEWRSILRNTLLGPEIQHSSHKDKRNARKTASEMLTRYDLGGFLCAKPSELSREYTVARRVREESLKEVRRTITGSAWFRISSSVRGST